MTEAKRGWRWELLGGALPAAIGLAANLLGAAHIPRGWLAAGLAVLATAGAFVGRAASRWSSPSKSRSDLIAAIAALVVLLAGIATYHQWFDPARATPPDAIDYTPVKEDRASCVPLSAEPDGPVVMDARDFNHPACGGYTVPIRCQYTKGLPEPWLGLAQYKLYAPASKLRRLNGQPTRALPHC